MSNKTGLILGMVGLLLCFVGQASRLLPKDEKAPPAGSVAWNQITLPEFTKEYLAQQHMSQLGPRGADDWDTALFIEKYNGQWVRWEGYFTGMSRDGGGKIRLYRLTESLEHQSWIFSSRIHVPVPSDRLLYQRDTHVRVAGKLLVEATSSLRGAEVTIMNPVITVISDAEKEEYAPADKLSDAQTAAGVEDLRSLRCSVRDRAFALRRRGGNGEVHAAERTALLQDAKRACLLGQERCLSGRDLQHH